jgi:hypothetical protein
MDCIDLVQGMVRGRGFVNTDEFRLSGKALLHGVCMFVW